METEHITSLPTLPADDHATAKEAILAATALDVGGDLYCPLGAQGPQGHRGPKGKALKVIHRALDVPVSMGKSATLHSLLEDSYGRQYIRDHKGTIRRVAPKK